MSTLRLLRRKASRSSLRVPLVWYRHRGITPKDSFVASYPRSGSTWLRFLLLEVLTRDSSGFDRVNQTIPDVGRHRGSPELISGGGRLIKTHEAYRPEYAKAVYLVRDLRDVVLSEFEYEQARERISEDFDEFLMLSLKANVNGYGTWQNHLASWLDSPLAASGRLLLVKFEQLRSQTENTLAEVLDFLGVPASRETVREAVRNNSVGRMRSKEDQAGDIDGLARSRRNGDTIRFIRSGAIGGWRNRLTDEQVRLIEREAGAGLRRLDYPLETAQLAVGAL